MMPRPYSNKLCWRVITHYDYTHSSFRFQYRLLTMTTFFEIAAYILYNVLSTPCTLLSINIFHRNGCFVILVRYINTKFSKVAPKVKSCSRLLRSKNVAQYAKSCKKSCRASTICSSLLGNGLHVGFLKLFVPRKATETGWVKVKEKHFLFSPDPDNIKLPGGGLTLSRLGAESPPPTPALAFFVVILQRKTVAKPKLITFPKILLGTSRNAFFDIGS